MALSLDTIITVATLVRRAVDLYNRIEDWPEQMKKLGRRMKNLNVYLTELEEVVSKKPNSAFGRLFPKQKQNLGVLLEDVRKDTQSIEELFHKWQNDIGPLGFRFRFKTLTQAYFALGSSSDKIASLIEDVDVHLQGIRDYLMLLGFKATLLIGERQSAQIAQVPVLGKPAKGPADDNKDNKNKRKPSPSPSPAPPRRDFKVIFVDPSNLARSVVGEALCKLMREWTRVSNGDWRIQTIHSAGLLVKDRTDVPEVESLKRDVANGRSPNSLALDAIFDNKAFDFPAKKDVHIAMLKKRSVGIRKDIFKKYDFILVFTSRDHENMLKMRSALIEKDGQDEVTARGKGRILHLGSYLTLDGIPREIKDARNLGTESKVTRADWNWKTAQVKLAVKEFLKQEMQWKQPPQKAEDRKLDASVILHKHDATGKQPGGKVEEKMAPEKRNAENNGEKKSADKKDGFKKPAAKQSEEKTTAQKKPVEKKSGPKNDEKKPTEPKDGKLLAQKKS